MWGFVVGFRHSWVGGVYIYIYVEIDFSQESRIKWNTKTKLLFRVQGVKG